jgi:hypothetical protein
MKGTAKAVLAMVAVAITMGTKYDIEMVTIEKPKDEYMTEEYFELDLPVAPAIMVGDEIVAEGTDISKRKLEAAIRASLQ